MTDENLEAEVRRTLHAKAGLLDVDERAFDPGIGSVVDLDDAPRRRTRTLWTALVAAAVIIAVIGVAVSVRSPGSSRPATGDGPGTIPPATPTASQLLQQVTSIPAAVFRAVGTGSAADASVQDLPGPLLRDAQGKVRILYVGAEYCPYCAGERWPLIIALSHFGTFSDLGLASSAKVTPVGSPEVFPATRSFTFHGSSYQSDYFDFEAVEAQNNNYEPLDELTAEQQSLVTKYDAPPYVPASSQGAIPFVDIGNRYLISGASFDIGVLQDKSHAEIAAGLSDPTSDIAQAIVGTANAITAALCEVVGADKASQIPVCRAEFSGGTGGSGPQG